MLNFNVRGRRLWENLLLRDPELADETNPNREVAVSACHTADRVDDLEIRCQSAEPTIVIKSGAGIAANPLYIECRNQSVLLARLIAALRLPDAASGARPAHRQLRGVQQPSTSLVSSLSSLERARQRANGA